MSHDLIRQSQRPSSAQLPSTADDLWMQQQSGLAVAQPAAGNDVQPLKLIHRSLRGRYKIAVALAAIGAAVGVMLGWQMNQRTYRARGLVKISPTNQTLVDSTNTTEYGRYMMSEATNIRSTDIVEKAIKNPAWTDVAGNNTMPVGAFFASLQATYVNNSQDILVSFDHPNKEIAKAGLKATLAAYEQYRSTVGQLGREEQTGWLEGQKKQIEDQIKLDRESISALRREHDKGNIEKVTETKGVRVADYESRLSDEQILLEQMELQRTQWKKNPKPMNPARLAQKEPIFERLLGRRNELETELLRLTQTMGQNAQPVIKLRGELNTIQASIDDIAKALQVGYYGEVMPLNGKEIPVEVSDDTIEYQKEKIALLEKSLNEMRKDLNVVDDARLTIVDLNDKIDTSRKSLVDVETKLQLARGRERTINAPFRTLSDPDATVSQDKRPTMATFGLVVGAGLPVLALALYGLFDRRFRYSDEASNMGGTRGIPLLGILPNLPDRLSDPSQASVAAHCVHQIRTMLQLNCLSETSNVLSITSATSGDGKTSLSLALGLSFAASGSRTLLIDTDLIGGGLSARLGIREPVGIGEAILARNPMEFVRDTDVTDLSVLPVGTQGGTNASAFSPAAVRRMIGELRKHFDIILIDTGPILGSIEATPVVAASDAVILTVARTQNRDMVEKAINQLRSFGSRIAGVVFNRANARDFERSVSGISLRSMSRAQANGHASANGHHQDKRLGPLVHSVRGTQEDN